MSEFKAPCDLEYLRLRCYGDCGDRECWQWRGSLTNGKFPKLNIKGKQYYARRLAWMIHNGKEVPPDRRDVTDTCGNHQCVNPRHLKAVTRRELLAPVVRRGCFNTHKFRASVALAKRASNRVSEEAVEEIRTSTEPVRVLAAKHGISKTYGHMIRRGDARRDWAGNPFVGLMR